MPYYLTYCIDLKGTQTGFKNVEMSCSSYMYYMYYMYYLCCVTYCSNNLFLLLLFPLF